MYIEQNTADDMFLGVFSMPIDEAKKIKEAAKVAVLIVPKYPYFTKGIGGVTATFSHPTEIRKEVAVIIANIRCAFFLGTDNNVIGAFSVR